MTKTVLSSLLLVSIGLESASSHLAGLQQQKEPYSVKFFRTYAFVNDDAPNHSKEWILRVNAWAYRPKPVRLWYKLFSLFLTPKEGKNFLSRVENFSFENINDELQGVRIRVGNNENESEWLQPILRNPDKEEIGHIYDTYGFATNNKDGSIPLAYTFDYENKKGFPGSAKRTEDQVVQLIEPNGLSIISDIDDTIKISEVWDHKRLFENTLEKDFVAVNGMKDLYDRWKTKEHARFHYVSASPWPLYDALVEFFDDREGFPHGALHLKPFAKESVRRIAELLTESPFEYKKSVIMPILEAFPKREFILFGDSTEEDPEIYGYLASPTRYGKQIRAICIRVVTEDKRPQKQMTEDRIKKSIDANGVDRMKFFVAFIAEGDGIKQITGGPLSLCDPGR